MLAGALVLLLAMVLASLASSASLPSLHLQYGTPTYCIDPQILLIASARAEKCFHRHGSASQELSYLRGVSVADYHRAHELLAFQYFVEYKANPHRRPCESADFEYIPLLPLAWRSGVPTSTSCTAGGYCPRTNVTGDPDACSVKALIDDIVAIVQVLKTDRKQADLGAGIPKASASVHMDSPPHFLSHPSVLQSLRSSPSRPRTTYARSWRLVCRVRRGQAPRTLP